MDNPNKTPECTHDWWYHRAGTLDMGGSTVEMFEARCNKCGAGRVMNGYIVVRELGLVELVGRILQSVFDNAKDLIKPLFEKVDSSIKQSEVTPK